MELTIKVVHLYFIPYYITNLCLIYDSNNLMTYLFWSPKNTINFFECSSLIYIKYVKSINYDLFLFKEYWSLINRFYLHS